MAQLSDNATLIAGVASGLGETIMRHFDTHGKL
jgi:NADP-dependent 3-hydroxy acid dehydrogenase YdfG